MDELAHQRELRRLRDEVLSTPNCEQDLTRMEPADVDGEPVWQCPECGVTRPA